MLLNTTRPSFLGEMLTKRDVKRPKLPPCIFISYSEMLTKRDVKVDKPNLSNEDVQVRC